MAEKHPDAELQSVPSTVFCSELWKQSDYIRRWNLRYFELHREGLLHYYHRSKKGQLRGIFLLSVPGCSVARTDGKSPPP